MTEPYDPQNIFAKILRGEIPSHKVFEDDTALVMMDLFPQSRGHTLIVPKAPSRNLLDADAATLGRVMPLVQRVAQAVQAALSPSGIRIAQFNEAAAGQTVFHLHFHVIPIYQGEQLGRHGGGKAEAEELEDLAGQIRTQMSANSSQ
ncbi:HIT family protein [Arsenicitalea aurantiaca]|uniref:HIT family protein n=1 Tax=Arsenicitalea aurantiaca TaxID=1783274 RepID=A0A433XFW2_9HYPH|nr:HIT family protein [Arsenicitalea aurantiaca]RUT32950.1 HIT family protein [Arsenicitalea aurantiaca]